MRASSAEALKKFDDMTLSEILQVPHHIYTHIIHVPRDLLQMEFGWKNLVDVEKVGRMTPEPAAFVYEYVHEDQDGKAWGEFSFCWPDEIEKETNYIMAEVEGLLGQPTFLPIFYLPKELVGAPTHFEFKEDDEFNFGDEEDGI